MNRNAPTIRSDRASGLAHFALLVAAGLIVIAWPGSPLGAGPSALPPTAEVGTLAPAPGRLSGAVDPGPAHPGPFGPVAVGDRAGYSGHYYAGAQYTGPAAVATDLSFVATLPEDTAEAGGDFFYVLISAWDSASSYDQLGFTDSNGTWGLSYSSTGPCASSYNFSANALALSGGASYRFDMALAGGRLNFTVGPPGGPPIWVHSVVHAASGFYVQNNYTCNSVNSLDLTDYEEVYTTAGPVPPYAFAFRNNSVDGRAESNWSSWLQPAAPPGLAIVLQAAAVTIENVPFYLTATSPFPAEIAGTPRSYSEPLTVGRFGTSSLVTLSLAGSVPGATIGLRPSSGTPPFTATLTVNTTSATPSSPQAPLELKALDTAGGYARMEVVVAVVPTLNATAPVATPAAVDVGRSVTLTEAPNGGSGPYRFLWTGLPSGCVGGNASFTCTPNATGNALVSVLVTDALGFTSSSPPVLLVIANDLGISVNADVDALDVGQRVTFSVATTGGSGGLQFAWAWGAAGACVPSGATLSCGAEAAGTLVAIARVNDLGGSSVIGSAVDDVFSDPHASLTATAATGEVGASTTFSLRPSGGAGGDRAEWTGAPGGCASASALTLRCAWSAAGTYEIDGAVVDRVNGTSLPAELNITVGAALTVTLEALPSLGLQGSSARFLAQISGGVGPLGVTWTGLPPGCGAQNATELTCRPTGVGSYTIGVAVTDALGVTGSANATFRIGPSLFGLPLPTAELLALGVSAAALALAVLAFVWRRRRGPSEGTSRRAEPNPPPSTETAGPAA